MKKVILSKTFYGLTWDQKNTKTNSCKCIMSEALGKTIYFDELQQLNKDGIISDKEFDAIRHIDESLGGEDDLNTIKEVAKRYNIEVIVE